MSAHSETDTILDVLYTSSHLSLTTVFQADVFSHLRNNTKALRDKNLAHESRMEPTSK